MSITDILSGIKDKVLDAATYDLLMRNFELLASNYQLTKDELELVKNENEKLKAENLRLYGKIGGLGAEIDILKGNI